MFCLTCRQRIGMNFTGYTAAEHPSCKYQFTMLKLNSSALERALCLKKCDCVCTTSMGPACKTIWRQDVFASNLSSHNISICELGQIIKIPDIALLLMPLFIILIIQTKHFARLWSSLFLRNCFGKRLVLKPNFSARWWRSTNFYNKSSRSINNTTLWAYVYLARREFQAALCSFKNPSFKQWNFQCRTGFLLTCSQSLHGYLYDVQWFMNTDRINSDLVKTSNFLVLFSSPE